MPAADGWMDGSDSEQKPGFRQRAVPAPRRAPYTAQMSVSPQPMGLKSQDVLLAEPCARPRTTPSAGGEGPRRVRAASQHAVGRAALQHGAPGGRRQNRMARDTGDGEGDIGGEGGGRREGAGGGGGGHGVAGAAGGEDCLQTIICLRCHRTETFPGSAAPWRGAAPEDYK